jgi:L-asparaginase II
LTASSGSSAVVAEVVRSAFVESRHRGSVVALRADGTTALAIGSPREPIFPRSSNKPLQTAAMVTAGLGLPAELLALVSASHSGEPVHVDGVRRILDSAGLDVDALRNTPDLPLDADAADALLRAGGRAAPLYQNCSGKHAGMLATCVGAGWPLDGYLDCRHPVQEAIRSTVERLAGERVAAVGVDGCGAPVLALSLVGLARAFRALATAPPGSAERTVADALRGHPHLLGGTGRDVTRLVAGLPGCIAKDGAEGVYAAALADGSAVALKVDDGAGRARTPVLVAALRALGAEAPVLDELAEVAVLGHGRPVGAVRAVGFD